MPSLTRNEAIAAFIGVVVVAFIFIGSRFDVWGMFSRSSEGTDIVTLSDSTTDQAAASTALQDATNATGVVTKLVIEDLKVGEGEAVKKGDTVTVNYIGTLQDGREFDNSFARGESYIFTVGEGEVIEGWDQGVIGMKKGGQRVLVVPASLGYGNRAMGPIPPNSTLVFAIEITEIR